MHLEGACRNVPNLKRLTGVALAQLRHQNADDVEEKHHIQLQGRECQCERESEWDGLCCVYIPWEGVGCDKRKRCGL